MIDFLTYMRKQLRALWDTKKIQTGVVFVLFNVAMPLYDLITDICGACELFYAKHHVWGATTLFWMFGPFIFNFILFLIKLIKNSGHNNSNGLCKVFLHFPFILPVTNSILAIHLLMADLTNPENAGTIEMIKRTAALSGLYESFLESGPQLLTQIHIILSTGQTTDIQKVLIFGHVLNLTLKACKAFYVQRKSSKSDPAPEGKMLILLFPLMFINVLNGTAQWTVIAGLLKHLVPIPLIVTPLFTWILLKKMSKKETTSHDEKQDLPMIESVVDKAEYTGKRRFSQFQQFSSTTGDENSQNSRFSKVVQKIATVAEDTGNDEGFFSLKASLTSSWLPCVVGDCSHTFSSSAFFSLFIRSVFLFVAVIFSCQNWYPDFLEQHSFLLHCNSNATELGLSHINDLNLTSIDLWKSNTTDAVCDDFWEDCFVGENVGKIFNEKGVRLQLHRVCGETEEMIPVLGVLVHLILLSLMANYLLNRLTCYLFLYQISKVFFSVPIIHRSLLVQLIQCQNHEKLKEICDIVKNATGNQRKSVCEVKEEYRTMEETVHLKDANDSEAETILDRQCKNGYSPLHIAVLGKEATSVRILLESGAQVQQDSTEQHPLTSAFAKDIAIFEMMILYANKTQIRKAFQQAVESNNIPYVLKLLNHSHSFILYRSNIPLGEKSQDQIQKKYHKTGEEKEEIRSITVNFNKMTWLVGLELFWSDGTKEVLGRDKDNEHVCDSVKVDAPRDRSFSFVRGQTSKQFIMALAFDTVSASGIVEPGEWIRSSVESEEGGNVLVVQPHSVEEIDAPKYKEVHTLGMLDIGDTPIRCVLDGFKGRLDANLVVADLLESAYDYRYLLTNLAATYRFTSISDGQYELPCTISRL